MNEQAKRAEPDPRGYCDHICLKDAEHVERGEPHFYGYEIPSPRRPASADDDSDELHRIIDSMKAHTEESVALLREVPDLTIGSYNEWRDRVDLFLFGEVKRAAVSDG